MSRIHINNFATALASGISDVAASMTLDDSIPGSLGAGETLRLTISDNTNHEIIEISSYSGAPTYSITRAREGTTARTWAGGTGVSCRLTKGSVDDKQDVIDGLAVPSASIASGDKVLFQDITDGDSLKYDTATNLLALQPASALTYFSAQTASASSQLDFTSIPDCAYMMFVLLDVVLSTDDRYLEILTSTDNGSSYSTTSGNYGDVIIGRTGATTSAASTSSTAAIRTSNAGAGLDPGNATGETINGQVYLYNPAGAGHTYISWNLVFTNADGSPAVINGGAVRKAAEDVNAIRFRQESGAGTITSGQIIAYKLSKT
jgi:hypothetical protein